MVKINDVYTDAKKGLKIAAKNIGKFKKPVNKVPYIKTSKVINTGTKENIGKTNL